MPRRTKYGSLEEVFTEDIAQYVIVIAFDKEGLWVTKDTQEMKAIFTKKYDRIISDKNPNKMIITHENDHTVIQLIKEKPVKPVPGSRISAAGTTIAKFAIDHSDLNVYDGWIDF